jgi:hypothetical protein
MNDYIPCRLGVTYNSNPIDLWVPILVQAGMPIRRLTFMATKIDAHEQPSYTEWPPTNHRKGLHLVQNAASLKQDYSRSRPFLQLRQLYLNPLTKQTQ